MKPLIRTCEHNDIQAICDMEKQWAQDEITYGYVPDNPIELIESLGAYFLVAELEGKIVGYIRGKIKTSKDNSIMPDGIFTDAQ